MKRIFLITTLLLASVALAFAQEYDFKLNLQPNLRVPLRSTNVITQKISVPGSGTQEVKIVMTTEVAFYVTAVKEGNFLINGIINERKIESESAGQKMTISGKDSVENQYNKDLIAITGKTFVAEITPKFELVGEVKPLNDDMTAQNALTAFTMVKDFFKGIYPEKAVKKGESWTAENKDEGLTATITLTDVNDASYVLDSKLQLVQEIQGITLKGEGTQNVEVNRAMGIPIYGLATVPVSGSLNTPMGVVSVEANTISSFELIQ